MPTTFTIDPVTRIEGHLEIEVTVDLVSGQQKVVEARSAGTMFRGFEIILPGRDPRDAALYTQRICGVCPMPHALASCLTLDQAFGVTPPDNGRILRNLVLGANFIESHLLHFYHLSALDYIDTTGVLDMSPWMPRYVTGDMIGGPTAAALVDHYRTALAMRRKAHQMGAIFAGKLPCIASFVVGGCTEPVTGEKIAGLPRPADRNPRIHRQRLPARRGRAGRGFPELLLARRRARQSAGLRRVRPECERHEQAARSRPLHRRRARHRERCADHRGHHEVLVQRQRTI